MKKKLILIIIFVFVVSVSSVFASSDVINNKLLYDGKLVELDKSLLIQMNNNPRILLKDICLALNINIQWVQHGNTYSDGHFNLIKDYCNINIVSYDRESIPRTMNPNWIFIDSLDSIETPTLSEEDIRIVLGRFGYKFKINENSLVEIQNLNPIYIYINNKPLIYDVKTIIYNNMPLLPMRAILESIGGSVEWDQQNQMAYALINNKSIYFDTKSNYMLDVNKKKIGFESPIIILNDRTLIPMEALKEFLECSVKWVDEENSIYINI